jgi:antitoxin component YwqK of YwqJK toxin-antitoxin module
MFTGRAITYHSDNTETGMRTETNYRLGLKHGDKIFYNQYPGSIDSITPYNQGKIDGTQKTYYANGKLKYEIEYKEGREDGNWKKYYTDGTTVGIHFFYKNGKRIKTIKRDIDLFIGELL